MFTPISALLSKLMLIPLQKTFILFLFIHIIIVTTGHANPLEICNQSNAEILNIYVEPVKQKQDSIFLRLDLAPGASAKIDNPACLANLRVDTGIQLWLYKLVALQESKQLLFCPDYPGCLALQGMDGNLVYEAYGIKDLVPAKGAKPVCELSRFRPMMPMKEVCALLEADATLDDNGNYLTGLGFAGKLWAARLAPFQKGEIKGDSLLEHMELRKALTRDDIVDVLATLYRQNYVPWQAEFPGQDIDFYDLPARDSRENKELLMWAIDKFLNRQGSRGLTGPIKNPGDEDGEASILLAPSDSLAALANADNPVEDVQLFTMILKPFSSTLLLDVSAYKGGQ